MAASGFVLRPHHHPEDSHLNSTWSTLLRCYNLTSQSPGILACSLDITSESNWTDMTWSYEVCRMQNATSGPCHLAVNAVGCMMASCRASRYYYIWWLGSINPRARMIQSHCPNSNSMRIAVPPAQATLASDAAHAARNLTGQFTTTTTGSLITTMSPTIDQDCLVYSPNA